MAFMKCPLPGCGIATAAIPLFLAELFLRDLVSAKLPSDPGAIVIRPPNDW